METEGFSGYKEEYKLATKRYKLTRQPSLLFSPLVLTTNLVLLLGSEVILDVERFANLLRRLALNHVGDGLAADVQQSLDIKVVCSLKISLAQKSQKDKKIHIPR